MERRDFGRCTLGSLLTFSLLESVMGSDAITQPMRPVASKWLTQLHEMGNDLKGAKLSQVAWQRQVESLFKLVDLKEFLSYVDFATLTKDMQFKQRGERAFRAKFPRVDGLPTNLVFGHQMFALRKSRSVVPHGHNNMATAFLILQGNFEGKHYDRLEDYDDHMIIRPTIDAKFSPGDCSTISDHKDNVHWFKATSETAYIFNIHVLNVDPSIKKGGRVYVDPFGDQLAAGKIRAKKLGAAEAFKRFG